MNIAINTISENPFAPSGAQGYYFHLINEMGNLITEEEKIYVFCSKSNYDYFSSLFQKKVQPVVFPYSNENQKLRVLSEHILFPQKIKENKIDVYNCGNLAPWWLPQTCSIVSTIKTMHAFTNPNSMSVFKKKYRIYLGISTSKRAKRIISNSESNTSDIVKYLKVPLEKIDLVYEAVDHNIFKKGDKIKNEKFLQNYGITKPYILFVSSFYKYKNIETLIKAYAGLEGQDNYQLVLVGYPRETDYYNMILGIIHDLNLENNIILTGGVPNTDTSKFYQSAELFVYPSQYETFGLTILEAMACGCPVITSNISSMPEIGGEAALYFDVVRPESLTLVMKKILANNDLKKKYIAKGLDRSAEFSWRNTAFNTLEVFRKSSYIMSN